MNKNAYSSVIIPMLVEAYLSDGIDVETKRVPQVSPDYSSALYHSFLGSQNTPSPIDSMLPPLKRGVHLHFIIPDAFKRADEEGVFPLVPDRYVVTRLITSRKEVEVRQWMVESNFISTEERYAKNVSIPMFSDSSQTKFRYCGRFYDLRNPPKDKGEYLNHLTAVGGGDPLFAAYYPSCHSIFGFRDDMAEVEEGTKVSYIVMGYFADSTQDPFYHTSESFQEILSKRNLSVEDKEAVCDKGLLFGIVEGIVWTNGTIIDQIPKGNIDVAVGKTSAEALSAVVEKLILPEDTYFQRFFNALQYAESDRIDAIDGEFHMDDEILLRQFQRLDGANGTYALKGSDEENTKVAEAFAEIINKKLTLGHDMRLCESERKKLFCLWEQYMLLYENNRAPKEPSREVMLQEIKSVADAIIQMESQIEAKRIELEGGISEIMLATGEEAFYVPKEPALLLSGDGIKRSYAFGENGRYTNDGTLVCQTAPMSCNIESETLLRLFHYDKTNLNEEYELLFIQGILLLAETKAIIEKEFGTLTIHGKVSPIAINSCPGDFVSLFMDWQVIFHPIRTSEDNAPDNTLSLCSFTYGETDFTTKESIGSRKITYSGRNVLTPHATINLKQRYLDWLERQEEEDEEAKKVAELLDKMPIISQNMGGLNDQLGAMMQAYQFPIIGNREDGALAGEVAKAVSPSRSSVLTSFPLLPLRGGFFRISQINIVGTFGQIQQVYAPSFWDIPDTVYGETMKSHVDKFGYLNPGFIIPSRVAFHWLWKKGFYSSEARETTPVEGFIVPELLNRRFVAYDNKGKVLGEVKAVKRNGKLFPRWLSAPGVPSQLEQISMSDILKKFLTSMMSIDNRFVEVMKVVDKVLEKTVTDHTVGAIWGKTLALSKAEVSLEFHGQPEFTKGFSQFGKYNTLGVEAVKIPLALGDVGRSLDGFIGAFKTDSFDYMYPPFGMTDSTNSSFVKYGETITIANGDGKVPLYLLSEVSSSITIQTGMHPISSVKLFPEHAETAQNLMLLAEINPVITPEGEAELSIANQLTASSEVAEFLFQLMKGEEGTYWNVKAPDVVLKDTVICDGRLVMIQEKEGRKQYE